MVEKIFEFLPSREVKKRRLPILFLKIRLNYLHWLEITFISKSSSRI